MSGPAPSFFIIEDHALFRVGLGMMLVQAWPDATLQEVASLAQARQVLPAMAAAPDVLLLDIWLPDGDGLAALPELKALAQGAPVLAMSADLPAQAVQRARALGAAGCLSKGAAVEVVQDTVREVLAGHSAFGQLSYDALSPRMTPQMAWAMVASDQVASANWLAHFEPTDVQRSILATLAQTGSNKAIARQLGLTEMQVRAELSWLTEVLDARSRQELYARAQARGWVSPC